jgi:hypothetical protein
MDNSAKKIKLADGSTISNGQLHPARYGTPKAVLGERDQTAPGNLARTATREKTAVTRAVPVTPGMTRQTQGKLSPHIHGVALCDECLDENKSFHFSKGPVPIHPGMTTSAKHAATRGEPGGLHDGSEMLKAGGRLSQDCKAGCDFDESHIGHKVFKGTSLSPLPLKGRDI